MLTRVGQSTVGPMQDSCSPVKNSATLLSFPHPLVSVGAGLLDLEGFWKQSRTPENYHAILLVGEMGKLKLFQVYNYLPLSPEVQIHSLRSISATALPSLIGIDRILTSSSSSSKDHIHTPLTHFTQSR